MRDEGIGASGTESGPGYRPAAATEEMKVTCGGAGRGDESERSMMLRTPATWVLNEGNMRLKFSSQALCTMCVTSERN